MANAPNTWKMCSLYIFWKSIFRSFTCFSLLICTRRGKKNSTCHFFNAYPWPKCFCVKEGRRGRRTWRTARRPGVQQQNMFSQPRFGDNNTVFHVACTPKPAMSLASVKRSPHWSGDESNKSRFSGDLASFLVCARKFIWLHDFLFAYHTFLKQDGVLNDPETMIKSVYYHTNFMVYSSEQMNEN